MKVANINMSEYTTVKLNEGQFLEWDIFVDEAEGGSIFCKSAILKQNAKSLAIWVIRDKKTEAIKCGIALDELSYFGFSILRMVKGMPYASIPYRPTFQNKYK